jgi:subfamily B ATP-binding cassette protein HlyB/CyaB
MPDGHVVGGSPTDTGLQRLCLVSRFFSLSLDAEQVRHDYGKIGERFDAVDIVRAAKRTGLLARVIASNWDRIGRIALPAIGELTDEKGQTRFVIFARLAVGGLQIQDPLSAGTERKTREEIEATWTDRMILMTHREALAGPARGFDLSWFIPALVRYRKLLGEVLVASFFLQLLGGPRTYVFSHTNSRINVEQGVGVFRKGGGGQRRAAGTNDRAGWRGHRGGGRAGQQRHWVRACRPECRDQGGEAHSR